MNTTILTLGLYRSSGGPSKSVSAFRDALGARVISWVDPVQYEAEDLVWKNSAIVRGKGGWLQRRLLIPRTDDVAAAEEVLKQSHLVSCHSFWRWHNIWLRRTARKHSIPFWFVPHGILDPYVFTKDRVTKRLFLSLGGQAFLNEAAAVVCATRREYEKLAHFLPRIPFAIIPWPLEESDFRTRNETVRAATRAALRIPEDAVVLLYLGRLHPMKQPLETIDTVARCRDNRCHLIMVGNECGVSVAECRLRAKAAGLEHRVHVVGPAYGADKVAYLDASDVYISLSHRENFNFTAAESMAAELPLLLSAGNDLASELSTVRCGWMVPAGQAPEAAIDAAIAAGDAQRSEYGRTGKAWASKHLRREVFDASVRALAADTAR
jgi:glycosyltransferase involved in cell wall biosynthesis